MDKIKSFINGSLRSKTMWFSFILVVLGAVSDNSQYLRGLLDAQIFNVVMIIIGVIVAMLRIQTTQPLDQK